MGPATLCKNKINTLPETDIKSFEHQSMVGRGSLCFFFFAILTYFQGVKLLFVSGVSGWWNFLPQPSGLQPGPDLTFPSPRTPAHRMMAMAAWKSSTLSAGLEMVDLEGCEEGTLPETKSKHP